jgi:hypothetical protein
MLVHAIRRAQSFCDTRKASLTSFGDRNIHICALLDDTYSQQVLEPLTIASTYSYGIYAYPRGSRRSSQSAGRLKPRLQWDWRTSKFGIAVGLVDLANQINCGGNPP